VDSLFEWFVIAAVWFDDNDAAAAAAGCFGALAVLYNAKLLVCNELENMKAEEHDILPALKAVWQLMAKQVPVVGQGEVRHLQRVQRLMDETVGPKR